MTPTVTATATPNGVIAGIHGIYALDAVHQGTQTIYSSILTDADVDGITIHLGWNTIETADGTYNWATLDSLIAQAAAANKKITMHVLPGYLTPTWVYAEGAQSFNFLWDKDWGSEGPALCTSETMPIPWDPIFLEKWTAFIQALGARYRGNTTVVGVKMTGVNWDDEETDLPYSVDENIGSGTNSCISPNYPVLWQQAGYTRTLIVNTWLQIAQVYQAAFPATDIMAVLQPFAFPPIDENGNIFSDPQGSDPLASIDIAAAAAADFPWDQIDLQNDALTNVYLASFIDAYATEVSVGFQALDALGANLPAAMSLAIGGDARYLEIYLDDLTNPTLTTAIGEARLLLLAN